MMNRDEGPYNCFIPECPILSCYRCIYFTERKVSLDSELYSRSFCLHPIWNGWRMISRIGDEITPDWCPELRVEGND